MDTAKGTQAGDSPSEGKADPTVLLACDICYQRKIRCDRKEPCGNCADNRLSCRRDRPKMERKPRERFPKEVSEVLYEIKDRLTSLETSFSHFIGSSTVSGLQNSRKRTHLDAFGKGLSQQPSPFGSSPHFYIKEGQDPSTPTFSVYEGQILIERELTRQPNLTTRKLVTFKSALASLKHSLEASAKDVGPTRDKSPVDNGPIEPKIPETSLIQWMLQCTNCSTHNPFCLNEVLIHRTASDTGRPVLSGSGFMPFVSQKTIGRMAQELRENPDDCSNLAALICVTSYAGYFLHEIVLSRKGKLTGFEDDLRVQAIDYLRTARTTSYRLAESATATLDNLQALTFGVMLAQEAGDFTEAWLLTGAASTICLSLKLHMKHSVFSDPPQDGRIEALYCFALCYMSDKGLAMNLGHVPYLRDDKIESNLLQPLGYTGDCLDNFCLYVELAKVQNYIIMELRSPGKKLQQKEALARTMTELDKVWHMNEQLRQQHVGDTKDKYDVEINSNMLQFAFFTIKTVAFHSVEDPRQSLQTHADALSSARSALDQIPKLRECAKLSQYNSAYMKASFAHWTVLYYPFTPFFVLFCNVVSMQCVSDYHSMIEFAEYLSEIKGISDPVAKLHKLCLPFCLLASSILSSGDSTMNFDSKDGYISQANAKGHSEPTSSSRMDERALPSRSFQPSSATHLDPGGSAWTPPQRNLIQQTTPLPTTDVYPGLGNTSEPFGYDWNFMGVQPMLQWLDSDFTQFEQTWGQMGGDGFHPHQ